MKEPTLAQIKREVEKLKRRKEVNLMYAKSLSERNNLRSEIKNLEEIKRSPNKLKSFGKIFGKGLLKSGKLLFKFISKGSRNLERSEFNVQPKRTKTNNNSDNPINWLQ